MGEIPMKNPHVYVCNGAYQLVFWDNDGNRKQKSTGAGDVGKVIAGGLQEALIDGTITAVDLLSGQKPSEIYKKIKKDKIPEKVIPKNNSNIQTIDKEFPIYDNQSTVDKTSNNIVTFSNAVCGYIKDLYARNKSMHHIKLVCSLTKNIYFKYLGHDTPINEIKYDDICNLIMYLKNKKSNRDDNAISRSTLNRYCVYLKAIFNFSISQGWIKSNPMSRWHKSKDKPKQFKLTLEDIKRIMDNAADHVRWAIEVCYNLGVRPGATELLALRYDDVDFVNGTISVYASKTDTTRTIPLKPAFLQKIKEMQKTTKEGYLIEYQGKRVHSIHKAFANAVERAGIKYDVRLYDLRHMFATFMLANGADLASVSNLMGHSSIQMTANVYYQCLATEKKRAISVLPDLPDLDLEAEKSH